MTIAVSILVGEGLVYAADSTTSLYQNDGQGGSQLVQSFHHAQKLLQLGDYPIGLMTYGLGAIGVRNFESLVLEFESTLLPRDLAGDWTVRESADQLAGFLKNKYDAVFAPTAEALPNAPADAEASPNGDPPPDAPVADQAAPALPFLGVVLGGYSSGVYTPEEYVLSLPEGTVVENRLAHAPFGARWWGQTSSLSRLLLGFDFEGVFAWLRERNFSEDDAQSVTSELVQRLRWPIIFDGMPLQDAIDFAVYLANVEIGHARFMTGPALCGGEVDVAAITAGQFEWIRKKKRGVKAGSVFY